MGVGGVEGEEFDPGVRRGWIVGEGRRPMEGDGELELMETSEEDELVRRGVLEMGERAGMIE